MVELEDGTELEKEFVFVSALVGMWSPANRLILYAGPGLEFESHSTFAIVKIGAEYEIFETDGAEDTTLTTLGLRWNF